jgi:hypothetical protein
MAVREMRETTRWKRTSLADGYGDPSMNIKYDLNRQFLDMLPMLDAEVRNPTTRVKMRATQSNIQSSQSSSRDASA